jgi:hypothetical protein
MDDKKVLKIDDCLNKFCPRSKKFVKENSLCEYRDRVFGFCNENCRDVKILN